MPSQNNEHLEEKKKSDFLVPCLEIGKLLTSTFERKKILEFIMRWVSQLIPAQNWSLLLKDDETGELKFEVIVGVDPEKVRDIRIDLGEGIAGIVAQTGEPLFVNDAVHDPRLNRNVDDKTGFVTESIVCIPLKIHGKTAGVIEMVNIEDMEKFREEKVPILTILSEYAAIAIENSKYITKIRNMSITDEYTGLYNARFMHEKLESLIREAEINGGVLSVAFIDLDDFKNVVDTYGHLAGSNVLREIGSTIRRCLDGKDIVFKYGGDEFVLVMPGRDKGSAINQSRKVLKVIREAAYLEKENHPVKLTASFGVASYPEDAIDRKELLLAADSSMYKVKNTTKNGVGHA